LLLNLVSFLLVRGLLDLAIILLLVSNSALVIGAHEVHLRNRVPCRPIGIVDCIVSCSDLGHSVLRGFPPPEIHVIGFRLPPDLILTCECDLFLLLFRERLGCVMIFGLDFDLLAEVLRKMGQLLVGVFCVISGEMPTIVEAEHTLLTLLGFIKPSAFAILEVGRGVRLSERVTDLLSDGDRSVA
jgi:hypothetical protein